MSKLTMGELFAGQCGFSVAGELSGIETKWMSEVEIAPIMVERARFPEAKQLGDVSKVNGAELEPVDVITFGSPCFVADTLIKTTDGLVRIVDSKGKHIEYDGKKYEIVRMWSNGVKETVRVVFEDGHTVVCTPNHRFLCDSEWKEAIGLKGESVVKDDWTEVKVLEVVRNGEEEVFDIEVEEVHLFPLANGAIAHNCQSVSVAGKRHGIRHASKGDEDTTRSGLFFDALRIIEEMREVSGRPRYGILENVVGIFSSTKGDDFQRVLEEFCQVKDINAEVPKLDKWPLNGEIIGKDYSLAWRVFDAQYWSVPQRRRRIYLLADFDGHSAGEIMFRKDNEDFHARINAWHQFGKGSEPMTGPEFIEKFNQQDYEIVSRETNEPSGKFARLDMSVGEWTFDVPEGYFIGEKPYYQNPTKLSEILVSDAEQKYYLSSKACQGILRRAKERGKELPEVLKIALENQAKDHE